MINIQSGMCGWVPGGLQQQQQIAEERADAASLVPVLVILLIISLPSSLSYNLAKQNFYSSTLVILAVLPSQHFFWFYWIQIIKIPFHPLGIASQCSVVYMGLMHISCRESFMKWICKPARSWSCHLCHCHPPCLPQPCLNCPPHVAFSLILDLTSLIQGGFFWLPRFYIF